MIGLLIGILVVTAIILLYWRLSKPDRERMAQSKGVQQRRTQIPTPSVGPDANPAPTTSEPAPTAPAPAPSVSQSNTGAGWGTTAKRLLTLLIIGGLLLASYHYRWDEWAGRQVSAFGSYMTDHARVIRPEVEAVNRPTTINVRFAAAKPQEGETVEFDMFWNTQARHIPPVFTRQELGAQTTWSCAQLVPGQTDHGITNTPFTWSNWTLSLTPEFRALLERDEPVRVQLQLTHTPLGVTNPCPAMWRG